MDRADLLPRRARRSLRPRSAGLALAALAALSPSALAQVRMSGSGGIPVPQLVTDARERHWNLLDYGNSTAGGSLEGSASATRSYVSGLFTAFGQPNPQNFRSDAALYSQIRLLGSSFEAGRVEGTAVNEPYLLSVNGTTSKRGYKPQTTIFARVLGNTVWSESFQDTTFSKAWSRDFGPIDTPRVSQVFTILYVPVTLQCWAGVGASVSLTASADLASVSLGLEGNAKATAYGTAQAGIGVPAASAGVAATLHFGNPSVQPFFHAGLFTGISGGVTVCATAIDLVLQLYAEIRLFHVSHRKTLDLGSWSTPESCKTYTF